MPTHLKIDYLEFPASDLDQIQSFYESVFGWTFQDYGPDYRAFTDGKMDGGFYQSESVSNADQGAPLVVFYADTLEPIVVSIESAGGTIVKPIFDFPGGRRFQFTDPHGNELAVWSIQQSGPKS